MLDLGITRAECSRESLDASCSSAFENEYSIFDEQHPSANVLTVIGLPKAYALDDRVRTHAMHEYLRTRADVTSWRLWARRMYP
jgi:hypothetical protein